MVYNYNKGLKVVMALLLCILAYTQTIGQTILQPGDLAIVGVNTNLSGCGGDGGEDEISLICFKDIEPGTVLQFTDNGWQRLNPGQWGNSEGFIVATRNADAPIIPAGNLIVFRFPAITEDIQTVLPDNEWTFQRISINALNFNSGGDQLYIMQGGIWDEGDTRIGNSSHNATYTGGNILFGFNSTASWIDFADNTMNSGLHPQVENCFHMEPTGGTSNFTSYQGPMTEATQLEWISRISNPSNWNSFPDCSFYERPATQFPLTPNNIELNCTTCEGCGFIEEKIVITLPEFGGPFDVRYTNEIDTIDLQAVNNQDTIFTQLSKTTSYKIVSVTDFNGCPIFSNLGAEITVVVNKKPMPNQAEPIQACNEGGVGTFILSSADDAIRSESSLAVIWYEDSTLMNRITTPNAYVRNASDTVYATIFDGNCESDPVPVFLELGVDADPQIVVQQGISCNAAADAVLEVQHNSNGGIYSYDWNVNEYDSLKVVIGVDVGFYQVTVTDDRNCSFVTNITIDQPRALDLSCTEAVAVSTVGGADGIAEINFSGGTAPFTIEWTGPSNGMLNADMEGTQQLDNLSAGLYNLTLTDANGCILSCPFTMNDPNCNLTVLTSKIDETCPGRNDGRLEIMINGGLPPYNIDWSVDSLDGFSDVIGLSPGNYTIVVTDDQNCTSTASVTINTIGTQPTVFIPDFDVVCNDECYEFDVQFTGTPPFALAYEADAGKGFIIQDTLFSDSLSNTFTICPDTFGLVDGIMQLSFTEIDDAGICKVDLNESRELQVVNNLPRLLDTIICQEDFLFLNGSIYDLNNRSGIERLANANVLGCDSIVEVNLSFFAPSQKIIDTLICASDAIEINGTTYNRERTSGTEVFPNASMNGCDSVVFIQLELEPLASTVIDSALCIGDSLIVNNVLYDEINPSGTEIIPRAMGCDSTVFVSLDFLETFKDTLQMNLCPEANIIVNGNLYNQSNPTGTEFLTTANGCDSIIEVDLDFNFIRQSFVDTTICPTEQIMVNGTIYDIDNPSGVETILLSNEPCDSFVNVSVSFFNAATVRLGGSVSVCPGDSANLVIRVFNTDRIDLELQDN
ncbi:MAG: hypothetical protein AAFO07_16795 [Bacteroidota bacterium]